MDSHEPAILDLLRAVERTTDSPAVLTTSTSASGTFSASVTYSYMQDGEITTRRVAFEEPLASDVSVEKRRDQVIVLLRRALMYARADGKVQR